MSNNKISAVVNTYNAGQTLEKTLNTLKGFDEIVVCDMESSDDTVDIARRYGCKVVTFPRGSYTYCEVARDFAIHSASNSWVILVDADELVTPELTQYLYKLIRQEDAPDGVLIPFLNLFMGKPANIAPEYHLRFFRQANTQWPPELHSVPTVKGKVIKLPARNKKLHIIHDHSYTISHHVAKCNLYTDIQAERRRARNYGFFGHLFKPPWAFFKTYILRGSWRYGKRGIIMAYLDMTHHILMLAKHEENKIKADENANNHQS